MAVIRRSPSDVFAYLSDLRNELEWNPGARHIVKLTDGPVGVGTRFQAQWRNAPRTLVEVVRYQPPHLWQTRSRSWGMDVDFRGELESEGEATRYVAHLDVSAGGFARLLLPLAVRAMRRQDEEHMGRIARALEAQERIRKTDACKGGEGRREGSSVHGGIGARRDPNP